MEIMLEEEVLKQYNICKISGSYSGEYGDDCLLGFFTV
jgi:hypothetical protein